MRADLDHVAIAVAADGLPSTFVRDLPMNLLKSRATVRLRGSGRYADADIAFGGARFGDTAKILRSIVVALAEQKPTVDIALLLVGSEPKMKRPKSPWPGISFYAPNVDGSARCLPDGGYSDALPPSQLLPDGGLIWE